MDTDIKQMRPRRSEDTQPYLSVRGEPPPPTIGRALGHEPEMPKSWEIKKGFFRFRGRSKPKLRNSEICVFEFLSFGFAWWFMESSLFLSDLLTGHEPEMLKLLEINKRIFRFMGRVSLAFQARPRTCRDP